MDNIRKAKEDFRDTDYKPGNVYSAMVNLEVLKNKTEIHKFEELKQEQENNKDLHQKPEIRTYNIKTLKVNWQGQSSIMHVFIDNTDVMKLEEATNNIKCQKIMFASVSHEFRTPLNAIINSYTFIEDSFTKIVGFIETKSPSTTEKEKKELQKNIFNINKFVKMGNNSSIILLALIEDILDLSKMESGTFKMSLSAFNVKELLEEVYDIFQIQ